MVVFDTLAGADPKDKFRHLDNVLKKVVMQNPQMWKYNIITECGKSAVPQGRQYSKSKSDI